MRKPYAILPALLVVLLLAGCASRPASPPAGAPTVPTPPTQTPPAPSDRPVPREPIITYKVLADDREVLPDAPLQLPGNGPVELVIRFSAPMDRASTEEAIRRLLPGPTLTWSDDDRTLTVKVPAGSGPFKLDLSQSYNAGRTQYITGNRTIERPYATLVSVHRLKDLLAGKTEPAYHHVLPQYANGFQLAPDGETALYFSADPFLGAVPPGLLHLPTGKVTLLDVPVDTYSRGGWLPDGRLYLAGAKIYVGNSQGRELKAIASGTSSWISALSPTGTHLAVWRPGAAGQVSLVDMHTGETRVVDGPFRRGAQDGGTTLAWSSDGKLLAGTDHDSDIDGRGARIRIIDPFGGKQVRTIEGVRLRAWLPGGHFLASRQKGPGEYITEELAPAGQTLKTYAESTNPSPEGRYLITGRPGSQGYHVYYLLDSATGKELSLEALPGYPRWTATGDIVVSR